MIECAIDLDCVFCVFVALFWDISWNQWCLSIRYFKRETYSIQNTFFGSLFPSQEIIKQKASKTWFFNFIIFEILWNFYSQNFQFHFLYNFNGKLIECAIDLDCIFCVFVALFWGISCNKCCLQITYFKRETYALQNAIFGSLFVRREIIKQKASKTRFFYFIIFWNFMKFSSQNFQFSFPIQLQWKNNWMCYWSKLSFLRFCCPFLRHFLKSVMPFNYIF